MEGKKRGAAIYYSGDIDDFFGPVAQHFIPLKVGESGGRIVLNAEAGAFFEDENTLTGTNEFVGNRGSAGPAADDDCIKLFHSNE